MIERRSASGVRLSGDDYHHLVAWTEAIPALFSSSPWRTLELEAAVPTSLDDIVIETTADVWRYVQAKYAADRTKQLNMDMLMEMKRETKRSLLQKLYAGWQKMKARGALASVELVTNRAVDPNDAVLRLLDSRDESLRRIVKDAPTRGPVADALEQWSQHLGVDTDGCKEFLKDLRIEASRSLGDLRRVAAAQMTAAGLVETEDAISRGVAVMRRLVTDDAGAITPSDLAGHVDHLERREERHDAIIVVEAIDDDHMAETASHRLDWRDEYPQDAVDQRITPAAGTRAYARFWNELRALHRALDDDGAVRIFARGTLRLASWFALGYALRSVDGFALTVQRGSFVTRSTTPASEMTLDATVHALDATASEAAVALAVSRDPTASVLDFIRDRRLPVSQLLQLSVRPAPGPSALRSDNDAAAVVARARDAIGSLQPERVHLFLACPAGVVTMLGHTWHRLPPVSVYEHTGSTYVPGYRFE